MRIGFDSGFSAFQVTDGGIAVIDTGAGLVPIQTAPTDALHDNPKFADVTAGEPDDWSGAFEVGGLGMAADPDGVFGTDAVVLSVDAGGGTDFQTILSGKFAVMPGDTVQVGIWAQLLTGLPWLQLGLLADPVDPSFIGADTTDQRTEREELTDAYEPFSKTFTIDKGCVWARMYVVVDSTAGEAVEARLSYSTSQRTGTVAVASVWTPLAYAPNWGDFGSGFERGVSSVQGSLIKVRGTIKRSSGSGNTAFTLLPEHSPTATTVRVATFNAVQGEVTINTDGTVVLNDPITNGQGLSFDFQFDNDQPT